jgi:hypothetical protein
VERLMTTRIWFASAFAAATALVAIGASSAAGQIRSSERGTVAQEIDGTIITVNYGRPQLRGRTPFPNMEKWGKVWTPGANWATTLEVNHPIKIDGQSLAAGKYSVWFTPGEKEWALAFHRDPKIFHMAPPKPAEMLVTIRKPAAAAQNAEVLAFAFPTVDRTGAVLEFRWGSYAIPLRIDVEPSLKPGTMTTAQAAPYVGDYTMIMYGAKNDSTVATLAVALKNGRLVATPSIPGLDFAIVDSPKPEMRYVAFLEKGEIKDIEVDSPLTWQMKGGRGIGFIIGDIPPGDVWIKAVRK